MEIFIGGVNDVKRIKYTISLPIPDTLLAVLT